MIIKVAVAIVEHQGKILISQRTEDQTLSGHWEFPGGKIDLGETVEACVVRELKEELDIEVKPKKKVWDVTYDYPDRTIELSFFICDWVGGEPKSMENQTFKWVAQDELTQYTFPPANKELIEKLSKKEIKL